MLVWALLIPREPTLATGNGREAKLGNLMRVPRETRTVRVAIWMSRQTDICAIVTDRCTVPGNGQTRGHSHLRRPGGYGGVAAPDPIPNSAVKRPSADGTSSQDAGE